MRKVRTQIVGTRQAHNDIALSLGSYSRMFCVC